jgi:hypothetical protein
MVAVGSNMFYTVTLPDALVLDKGKTHPRRKREKTGTSERGSRSKDTLY